MPQFIRHMVNQFELPAVDYLRGRSAQHNCKPDPIVIFTRAFNRLEYTIQCVDSVARQITDNSFIHVIIDQNSTDGTEQWFNWIHKSDKPFWRNIAYVRLRQNIGDWGGVALGNEIVSRKYPLTIQLDNDISMLDPITLDNMHHGLKYFPDDCLVMCRRLGAGATDGNTGGDMPLARQSKTYRVKLNVGSCKVYKVNHSVGCYICHRELISRALKAGCDAACKICDTLTPRATTFKLHDVPVQHLQGWDGKRFIQQEKYYRGSVASGMKYTRIPLSDIINQPTGLIDYAIPPACDPDWIKANLQIKQIV